MLLIAALNMLDFKGFNINNEFLSAPKLENNCMKYVSEFWPKEGKIYIVLGALYGIKVLVHHFDIIFQINLMR